MRTKKVFLDGEFAVYISGARNMEALKGKLGLGDSFQCRLVPKPQGPLDENNKAGTNLYGLSPSELMFVAIRFQGVTQAADVSR